jgi:hypothetical protein
MQSFPAMPMRHMHMFRLQENFLQVNLGRWKYKVRRIGSSSIPIKTTLIVQRKIPPRIARLHSAKKPRQPALALNRLATPHNF